VKVKHEVDFSADKYYQFSAKFRATQAVNGVTIKVDDNNGMIYEPSSVNIPANEDFTYTSAIVNGIPGNNKIIVFDFGYASPCQITISEILLQEVEKPADTEKPVLHSATLVEGSVTHNSAVLAVSATDNVKLAGIRVVDATNNYDKTFELVDGKITLTDLAPSTTYNFIVTAVDDSDNVSEASISVSLSTIALIYCDFPTGHLGDANWGDPNGRCLVTLTKLSDTKVRVTVKPNYDKGATRKLDYLYVISSGGTPHPAEAGADINEGGFDELSVEITYPSSVTTYSYTVQWSNVADGGRWSTNINNVTSSNFCPLPADNEKPVMESAALVSVTHNSAILTVSATDNDEVANYHVVDATNGYDQTIAPVGNQITLTGLTPSTSYDFTVTALDMAGNESDNSKSVTAETLALLYCDYPTGHDSDANFGNANGRILLSLLKVSSTHIRVVVKSAAEATENLDRMYIEAAGANPHATTIGSHVATSELRELTADIHYTIAPSKYTFMIQWSNPGWDGNWQVNINDVLESNLCPLPADEEKPVMESAALVSVTHNSAILSVSATDNDEVANYHVVDATNGYDQTIAPVGNQITLTGLTPATTYNFIVTALDIAGNESDNSKSVTATTAKLEYCEWLTGNNGDANFGELNGRCILTISKVTEKQLLVIVKPVSGANKLDYIEVYADGIVGGSQALTSNPVDELSVVLNFANTITEIPLFRVLWSNEGFDGNWMVELMNVKASYLCPHVELGESVDLSKLDLSSGITTDVKITRKFVKGSGKWNTLSLPFALTESEIDAVFGTAARVVELTDAIKTTPTDIDLTVSTVTDIVAGKPYLIQLPASYAPVVLEDMTLANITPQETETSNGLAKMVSVLTPIPFDDAAGGIRFFLNTNGKLSYRSTTNGIMNPYRAYFEFPEINSAEQAANVRARVVFNENAETGVDNIITSDTPTKLIQNGQLIIIRNGEKYNIQGQKL